MPRPAKFGKLLWSERASLVVLLLVLGVLGLKLLDGPRAPAIPPAVAATQDSLNATAPAFDSILTHRLATAERDAADVRRLRMAFQRLQDVANAAQAHGDSLAGIVALAVTSADSVAALTHLAEARGAEAVALRQSNDSLGAALTASERRGDSLAAQHRATLARLDATAKLNADLALAVRRATECRWGGPLAFPCPSRGQIAVGGVVLAGLVVAAAK